MYLHCFGFGFGEQVNRGVSISMPYVALSLRITTKTPPSKVAAPVFSRIISVGLCRVGLRE